MLFHCLVDEKDASNEAVTRSLIAVYNPAQVLCNSYFEVALSMLSILILVLVAAANTEDYRKEFEDALSKFSKQDGLLQSEPAAFRLQRYRSFSKFAKTVDEVNANDELTFSAENNFMSILTEEEQKSYMGLNLTGHIREDNSNKPEGIMNTKVAKSRDFSRNIGPIKNQGNCGSCWSFAATAALEGEIYFTNSRTGVSLSEQEYMECSTTNDGCQGGWMKDCYTYSQRSGRIAPSAAYRYTATDARNCRAKGKANALTITNTRVTGNIEINGDAELLKYANKHIVSVAIFTRSTFHSYSSGIYNDRNCNQQPNHAVAVVGYGSNYWKVRNSWGIGWGDRGYIKMSRDVNNICMISDYAHIPRVECRDNSCTVPDIDDDTDGGDDEGDDSDGDDSDGEGDDKEKLCKINIKLGKCYKKVDEARKQCHINNISKSKCIVTKINKCFYSTSRTASGNKFAEFYGPCEDDGSDDNNEGCDANAGLVMCRDCNCCMHKHMCRNIA